MTALLLDLDGVLGDTRDLWDDWLADTGRVLGVDPATLPGIGARPQSRSTRAPATGACSSRATRPTERPCISVPTPG